MIEKIKSSVKYWFLLIIAGIVFISGGILTFTFPLESYLTIAAVFSYLFLIEGLSEVIFSIVNRKKIKGWGWTLAYGVLSIAFGIFLIINPTLSASAMPLYLGFLFLAKSIVGIVVGVAFKKETGFGNHLIGIGALGGILSLMLLYNPLFAGFTILFMVGILLITSGIYSIIYGIEFRSLNKKIKQSEKVKEEKNDTDSAANNQSNETEKECEPTTDIKEEVVNDKELS
ncbi:DUF308 domain-containing protein [Flammeovirga yaeyamensis]|uniref:DUF308 domain-containing protein n=1 Tax=Flammeovirga yaeyamensis TaxID=367791 RepID=A0AAX1NDD7_9BACT|nr:HdeD family acid-resistance protein [Flammeovirga yaeyamensis]MBB3696824.1 uncharacterized membrane protein HdeD (DUF308 family) [Flammeovirga yaeyamensis]NMF33489.1 HdeD family acid-resistance protein [Flammeovirga yaeyamensis]QWG05237.1 DUF308 domain-containing protein [Flammeovirga yaeyamensis]